jgi:tetratricopeptide (TPR) repeat protein
MFPPLQYTGLVAELENKAKQFTVKIEGFGEDNIFQENGSGVIIAKEGDTYYVLTAYHVVENYIARETVNDYGQKKGNIEYKYKITAPDGKVYDIDNRTVKAEEGVDLAVVQFKSQENYPIATLAKYNVKRNDYTLVAGYPQLGNPNNGENNAPWRFTFGFVYGKEQGLLQTRDSDYKTQTSGSLASSAPVASLTGGYELVYTSMTLGGMSGGPVLDIQGRVIGIHGRGEGSSQDDVLIGNSLGISISTFLGMTNRLGVKPQQVNTEKPQSLSSTDEIVILATILGVDFGSDNTTAEGWMYRGNQLYRLGRNEEAIKAFDEAIKQKPDFIHLAYYGRGLALSYSGKYQEAITALQQATQAKPDFVAGWSVQSTAYRYLQQWESALTAINKAISLDANNPNLYNEKYVVLSELKRYDEALTAINQAIELAPRTAFYVNRGNAYINLQQYDKAIGDYSKAIELNPDFAIAYYNRGIAYYYLQQYDKAIGDYSKAIELNPDFAIAYYNRGIAYSDLQQYDKAIGDYNKAIELNPEDAQAYSNRGNAYSDLQQYDKAIGDYSKAIELNPEDAQAYYNRGIAYSDLQQYDKAIGDYNKAIELNPEDAQAYYNRGIAYSDLQQYDKAIGDYSKAIELNPEDAQAYYNRGIAYALTGEFQKALADAEKAAQLYRQQGNEAGYQNALKLISLIKEEMSK